MAKIDPQKRRQVIVVTIILSVALLGLVLITMQQGGQKGNPYTAPTVIQGPVLPNAETVTPAYESSVGKAVAAVSILKMIVALAVVIVCIYAGIFILKKVTGRKHGRGSALSLLEVIETAHIDPKKSLSLVRVADRSVLIGVTDSQISVLTELDSEHTSNLLASIVKKSQGESFGTLLKSASERFKGFGLLKDTPRP